MGPDSSGVKRAVRPAHRGQIRRRTGFFVPTGQSFQKQPVSTMSSAHGTKWTPTMLL